MDYTETTALLAVKHGSKGSLVFCFEQGAIYFWKDFGSGAPTADGYNVIATANGGETRWLLQRPDWILANETWTYASASAPEFTLTISGDKTTKYQAGQKVKLTQTTDKYFFITKVAYSAPDTTLTLYGGTDYTLANATITSPCFSNIKAPFGFPLDPIKWTIEVTDSTARTQSSPASNTWYNLGSFSIGIKTGCWRVEYYCQLRYDGGTLSRMKSTLSTANNSQSDIKWTALSYGGAEDHEECITMSNFLAITSAATYYLNSSCGSSGGSGSLIMNVNSEIQSKIRAICAYL